MPLFTDLDGTLVSTDVTVEAAFSLIRRNLVFLLLLPYWLCFGRARLKREVAARVELDAVALPYIAEFLSFLRQEHRAGRRLILATAADKRFGQAVAEHLGIFDQVMGSDGSQNLEAAVKLEEISKIAAGPFDYAGNDIADLEIFPQARRAVIVHPVALVRAAMSKMTNLDAHFAGPDKGLSPLVSALRPERAWMNLLVLLPFWNAEAALAETWWLALGALLAFTLASTAAAVFDDLLHLAKHRRLPLEAQGAIAKGEVAVQRAGMAIGVFWGLALILAMLLSGAFAAVLACYCLATVLLVQDWLRCPRVMAAMVLAVLRIAGGALLVAAAPSLWMLGLALLLGAGTELIRRHKVGFY